MAVAVPVTEDVRYDASAPTEENNSYGASAPVDEEHIFVRPPATAPSSANAPPINASTPLIQNQHTAIIARVGHKPIHLLCPYCGTQTVTAARSQIECVTLFASLLLFFVFTPLFWLPFCLQKCKSTNHYCSSCHRRVARVEPCS